MNMFPSKILLFGEYTVLLGSDALTTPYEEYSGRLAFLNDERKFQHEQVIQSNRTIAKFLKYLSMPAPSVKDPGLDLNALTSELKKGLYFNSNIPQGSGLGSSGALIAALFHRYGPNRKEYPENIENLQKELASLEDYFHGTSSGIDPLISYIKRPVYIGNNGHTQPWIHPLKSVLKNYGMFLVQSAAIRNTKKMVTSFLKHCKTDNRYVNTLRQYYTPVSNACIRSLHTGGFMDHMRVLSGLQLKLFQRMFTPDMGIHIKNGLQSEMFYLKLCGAGGGGHYLGFTENIKATETYFRANNMKFNYF